MSEGLCLNNRGRHGCQNVVTEGGEEDSGYCETCFWPGIEEANQKYAQLLVEGHARTDAAELSGLNDGERKHRYGTTMIDTVQQDGADDEGDVASHDIAANHILDEDSDEGPSGEPV